MGFTKWPYLARLREIRCRSEALKLGVAHDGAVHATRVEAPLLCRLSSKSWLWLRRALRVPVHTVLPRDRRRGLSAFRGTSRQGSRSMPIGV